MSVPLDRVVEENNLIIIDALNLAYRWKRAGSRHFSKEYIRTIDSLKKSYKAKYVIITCDKGSSSYRKSIYSQYKGNRAEKYAEQSELEKELTRLFFEDFNEALEHIKQDTPYKVIMYQGVEADDLASYLVKRLKNTLNKIWLISSDGDWDLLLADNVSRFSYVTRKEYTLENWDKNHDYTHDEYLSIKCIIGDAANSGDNIRGVPDVGPKRALELVRKYGSALDIVDALPISSSLKYIKNLNSCGELILLNYQLIDLVSYSELAIGKSNLEDIDNIVKEYINDG